MQNYEAPEIRLAGTVESLTAGGATGLRLDASFPNNTPFTDLTFS